VEVELASPGCWVKLADIDHVNDLPPAGKVCAPGSFIYDSAAKKSLLANMRRAANLIFHKYAFA
jgi:hypothetical protein